MEFTVLKLAVETKLIQALAELRKPDTAPLLSIHAFDAHHLHALILDAMLAASQVIDAQTSGSAQHG